MQLQLRTTETIKVFLSEAVSAQSQLDKATKSALQPYLNDSHVPYSLLLEAWTCARSTQRQNVPGSKATSANDDSDGGDMGSSRTVPDLTELLKGSEIVFPSTTTTSRSTGQKVQANLTKDESSITNPHLKTILDDIRRKQEADEYERMTGFRLGEPASDEPDFRTSADDPKAARRLVLTIVNVFFTAASVFVAVMWIGPTVSDNVAWRVLVAFLLALLVLSGEGWLAYRSAFQRPMM